MNRKNVAFGLVIFVVFGLAAGALVGCSKSQRSHVEPGQYGGNEAEFLRFWRELLTAAERDYRQQATAMMSSLRMSPAELALLFGEEKARRFWPRYELLSRPLLGPAAAELVAKVYEYRYDDVEVSRIDLLANESLSDKEKAVKRALIVQIPVYRARVFRKGQPHGNKYEFFVYLHGYWRTGRDLGQFLDPPGPLNQAARLGE